MKRQHWVSLSILLLFSTAPLRATETVPEFSDADPNCACVAQGKRWAQGEEACIAGISMVCGMNQNISTWKSLGTACQVSSHSRALSKFTPM
jgi:hypothetical protein